MKLQSSRSSDVIALNWNHLNVLRGISGQRTRFRSESYGQICSDGKQNCRCQILVWKTKLAAAPVPHAQTHKYTHTYWKYVCIIHCTNMRMMGLIVSVSPLHCFTSLSFLNDVYTNKKTLLNLCLLGRLVSGLLTFSEGSFRALRSSSSSSSIFNGLLGAFFPFESPLPSAFCLRHRLEFLERSQLCDNC